MPLRRPPATYALLQQIAHRVQMPGVERGVFDDLQDSLNLTIGGVGFHDD